MKYLSTIVMMVVLLLAVDVSMSQTPQRNGGSEPSVDPPHPGIAVPPVAAAQRNGGSGPSVDSAIVDKLRTIVTIRQRLAEANERAVRNGKGETDGRYELALAEARLELARELGQRNEQVAALKDILRVQQRRLEEAKKRAEAGTVSREDVDAVRVAVLEAEVRLLRAQDIAKAL